MHIVEALTTHALQDKMAVQAHFLAEAVASERAVFPLFLVVLHPEVNALEAVQVRLVEVLLLLVLFGRLFAHFADDRPGQLQGECLQRAEHEIEVQDGEEHDINGEQRQVKKDGDVGVEDNRQTHRDAVAQQVSRHVGVTSHASGQQEDVHNVVDAQPEGTKSHQDVAA